jgi:hypothetical protein
MYYPRYLRMLCVDSVILFLAIHGCFWRLACVWYRVGVDWGVCDWSSSGVVEVVVVGGGGRYKLRLWFFGLL